MNSSIPLLSLFFICFVEMTNCIGGVGTYFASQSGDVLSDLAVYYKAVLYMFM